jgi:hypothetical protein
MAVKLTWRGHQALGRFEARMLRGVAAAAADVAQMAAARAPVSKRAPGRRANRVPVVAVQPVRVGENKTRRGDVGAAITALELGDTEKLAGFEFRVAPTFRGQPQRRAGEAIEAERVFTSRGRLVTGGAHQPGTLKKSIKVISVGMNEGVARARVAALVRYAKPIEYGFRHKGGRKKGGKSTQVAARPFMRPALAEISEPYRTGKYFKG